MRINWKKNSWLIEPDRNSWIVKTLWTSPALLPWWKPNPNAGREIVVDEIYPATLEKALLRVVDKMQKENLSLSSEVKEIVKTIKETNEQFISNLQALLEEKKS